MTTNELRAKNIADLKAELTALLKEQFNLRMQRNVTQTAQTHLFSKVRKAIARVKTILREKEGS